MLCRKCSEEYTPQPEEARLIRQGDLVPICEKCAPAPMPERPPPEEPEKEAAETLWRAERTDPEGKIISFMRAPKKFVPPTIIPLQKPRIDHMHVIVLSEGNPDLKSSSPRTVLHTNIETFIIDRQNFWVCKLPAYWDGQTGIARIEIANENVVDVIKEKSLTRVRCTDGSEVRLYYRR